MLSDKADVLLIGISHPNGITYTISRGVPGDVDTQWAIDYMTDEMRYEWDECPLDILLVVDVDFEVQNIPLS